MISTSQAPSAGEPHPSFAIALKHAGWNGGGHLMNTFIFTAIFSLGPASIYIGSRTLFSLAELGRAPKVLLQTGPNGAPIYAVIAPNIVGLLPLINAASGAAKAFSDLVSMAGGAAFIAWACIGITHVCFRKAWRVQGHSVEELPFRAFIYPWGAYFVCVVNIFLVFLSGYATLLTPWPPVDFVFSYLVIPIFAFIVLFWKFYKKTQLVDLREVDLHHARRHSLDNHDESGDGTTRFSKAVRSMSNRTRL